MSLELLAIMVVAGIGVVLLAVVVFRLSRPFRFIGESEARAAFSAHYPEETPEDCLMSDDGKAAFFRLDGGRTGMAAAFGARYVCRVVAPGDIARVAAEEQGGLTIRLKDFSFPHGKFRFINEASANKVADWLKGTKR